MNYLVEHITWVPDGQGYFEMAAQPDEIFEAPRGAIEFARRWCRENEFNDANVYEVKNRWVDDSGDAHYVVGAQIEF